MQYIKPNGVIVEGTPQEIAEYHSRMTGGSKPKPQSKRGFRRAQYVPSERSIILKLMNKGKSTKQIAAHLWKQKISPIKRTANAIGTELGRMQKDPTRR